MGVVVLPPQDCLREGASYHRRPLISPPRSKPRRNTGTNNVSPPQTRHGRRKPWSPSGSPPPPPSKPHSIDSKSCRAKSPVITGQIRILKRGEELTPAKPSSDKTTPVKSRKSKREGSLELANTDPAVSSDILQNISVPEPSPIRNLFIGGFYAGSAFSSSPPPSSLPVPGFCTKSMVSKSPSEDVVAVDLRRLLRIES